MEKKLMILDYSTYFVNDILSMEAYSNLLIYLW